MKKLFTCLMLMVGMLLPLTATAADLKADLTIYYDVSDFGDFSGNKLQLMVGHDGYSIAYEMKAVEGYDNLYSVNIGDVNSGNSWGGANQLGIMAATSVWGSEESSPTHRFDYTSLKTGIYKLTKNLSGNVLFTGKSTLSITENYTLPAKDPVITIVKTPEFATTTEGETSTATVTYKVENSEEKPALSVDNDAFKAEIEAQGTIIITFAPTEAKEYTATLTLTIGEVKQTVEIKATAKAADAPAVPEILNLTAGKIAEIFAGETTEFEISYTLLNAEEATTSIQGEGFSIKKQDKGTATIEFAPTEAKTYSAVITVTSGDATKTLEIEATAKKVPTVITISFVNSEKWEEVALYAWGAEGLPSSWPGEKMTKGDNDTYTYQLTIPEDGKYSFIINNNKKDNATQTVDVEGVAESTCYNLGQKDTEGKYSLVVATNCTSDPVPTPELEFALVGRLNGDNDHEILKYEEGLKFTKESEYVYTLTTTFTGNVEGKKDDNGVVQKVQKVKLVDAQGNIWARNESKQIDAEGFATMTKGETKSSAYIITTDLDATYTFTYTLESDPAHELYMQKGQLTYQIIKAEQPDPVITIIQSEFPETEVVVGQEAEAMVLYSLENAESATVTIEGEYVTFEEYPEEEEGEGNAIEITFAPEEAGEYKGKLIIAAGDVSEVIEFTFIAIDEKPEVVINILEENFTQNEVEVGDDTEAIVVYSLENAESAVVTLEGEYFTMEEYPEEVEGEGNYIEITFKPEKAGEYTCKLTITAGDVSKVLEYPFYAIDPQPDTQIISVKVAAPENWESCYLWAWEIGGKDLFDTFPGVSMPKGEDGFYVMNLEISGPIGFLVSNGSGIQTEAYNDVAEDICLNVVSVEGNLILEVNENCEYVAPEIPKVTFTVLVPGGTQVCYIAGTPQWSPIEMEKVEGEENMFTITTDLLNGQEWKYCAGPNFDYVELTADGGDVKNRIEYGNPDVVAAWKAVYEPQPDIPTAVEEVEALGIYATDGTIYADDTIIIYTLAGVDVTSQNGMLYGIYIVKTANGSQLINVR